METVKKENLLKNQKLFNSKNENLLKMKMSIKIIMSIK